MSTVIVGVLLALIIGWALIRTKEDIKNNKCGGCSGCGTKSQCSIVKKIE